MMFGKDIVQIKMDFSLTTKGSLTKLTPYMRTHTKIPFWLLLILAMALSPVLSVWASASSEMQDCSSSCHMQMDEAEAETNSLSCTQHKSDCENTCQSCNSCQVVGMALPVTTPVSGYGLANTEYDYMYSLPGNRSFGNFRPPRA